MMSTMTTVAAYSAAIQYASIYSVAFCGWLTNSFLGFPNTVTSCDCHSPSFSTVQAVFPIHQSLLSKSCVQSSLQQALASHYITCGSPLQQSFSVGAFGAVLYSLALLYLMQCFFIVLLHYNIQGWQVGSLFPILSLPTLPHYTHTTIKALYCLIGSMVSSITHLISSPLPLLFTLPQSQVIPPVVHHKGQDAHSLLHHREIEEERAKKISKAILRKSYMCATLFLSLTSKWTLQLSSTSVCLSFQCQLTIQL